MGLTSELEVATNFLKGVQFEPGLIVKVSAKPELVEANEGYGFKEGKHAGKQVRFHFEVDGEEKVFDTNSSRMISALDPFKVGDVVTVKRTGQAMKTEWTAVRAAGKEKKGDALDKLLE